MSGLDLDVPVLLARVRELEARTPIDPLAIHEGDKVVAVSRGMETTLTVHHIDNGRIYATSGNAGHDSEAFLWADRNDWYLLDRPTPLVELPETPTLGWLTLRDGALSSLAFWAADNSYARRDVDGRVKSIPVASIAAFTPATAVPTEALDALREARAIAGEPSNLEAKNDIRRDAIETFIDAIPEANG